MLLGNRELLLLGVRRELDDVQVLQYRRRDRAGIGRGHDPQDSRQVERNLQVVVVESRPAPRVQDSQQHLDIILGDPVHRLDDEDRVVHPGIAQRLDDASRDIIFGAADQTLGVAPVQRQAHVGTPERFGDRHGQRGLADPAAAGQTENGWRGLWEARAHDQGGRSVGRLPAGTGAFDGQQIAGLRTGPSARRMRVLTPSRVPCVR